MSAVYVIRPDNETPKGRRLGGVVERIEVCEEVGCRVVLCRPASELDEDEQRLLSRLTRRLGDAVSVEVLDPPLFERKVTSKAAILRDSASRDEQPGDVVYMPDEDYHRFLAAYEPAPYSAREEGNGRAAGGDEVILGKPIAAEPRPLEEITDEERSVVVFGYCLYVETRNTGAGRLHIRVGLTDYTDSIEARIFTEDEELAQQFRQGCSLLMRGSVRYDRYSQELVLFPRDIAFAPDRRRVDTAEHKRVELHLHTKMSAMDATVDLDQLMKTLSSWGHQAVAITDHGVVQAFPAAYELAQEHGLKLMLGLEGYLVEDDPQSDQVWHIILIAQNETGLRNLYRLVTLSHLDFFYRSPRIPRAVLEEHRQGILVGSACEAGEVYRAVLAGETDQSLLQRASFYDYLEIQPLGNNEFLLREGRVQDMAALQAINRKIVSLAEELGKPVVATGDVHYLEPHDEVYRRILMAGQGYDDADQQAPLYLRTTEEMLAEFSYLGEETAYKVVVDNPVRIAEMVEEISPVPEGTYTPQLEDADKTIRQMVYANARQVYGDPLPEKVESRLEKELKAIIDNGFASLYLVAHKLVQKSLSDGYLVGSRGSVGSSLVATMCGITEVNPLPPHYVCAECGVTEFWDGDGQFGCGVDLPTRCCPDCGEEMDRLGFDIPFEVFMGFRGEKVPDIDLNFSGEYQSRAHKYAEELFGEKQVYRAGTISTLAERTAYGFVRNYLEEKGLQKREAEIRRLVSGCAGVRRTTGQHPGGLIVVPQDCDVFRFTPLQHPANDKSSPVITTHFEYSYMHDALVKLDILGHDDPTMLRMLQDLTGIDPRGVPLDDPDTLAIFSGTETLGVAPEEIGTPIGTLGIPEFNTWFVRQMLEKTRPKTFAGLVRISGLSHGEDVWTNNAESLIDQGIVDLDGVIACRDDIMVYLIRKGLEPARAFQIMEQVRKGRDLTDQDVAEMKQHGVPDWYIESCRKISYMFPKAHAVAYVTMAVRIAYFKVHYPEAFYAAHFSVRIGDFDADLALLLPSQLRRRLKELSEKGGAATAKEKATAAAIEVILEAKARGVAFLPVDIYQSDATRLIIQERGLRMPFIALSGLGESAARAIVEARKEGSFTSVEDLRKRAGLSSNVINVLSEHGSLEGMPASDQLTLF